MTTQKTSTNIDRHGQDRNETVVAFTASAAKADAEEHLRKFGVLSHSPGIAYSRIKCIK